jgi:nitroreductase
MEKWKNRLTEYPCSEIFLSRTSTRAFDPSLKISKNELYSCFEAAKWAPSSYNNQPWRYIYAETGSLAFKAMVDSMVEFNQNWAQHAQFLILICSRKKMRHNEASARTHSLDTGSSYIQFVLEAHSRNIACHAMDGFSHDKIRSSFKIPDIYQIEALMACGKQGDMSLLSNELKEKETPSLRLKIEEFVSCENFTFD